MVSAFENRFRHGLAVTLILGFGAYAYWNTLSAPYIFDDIPNIEQNQQIHIRSLHPRELWDAAFSSPVPGRPLAYVTFALNYYSGGKDPSGFHRTNLAIHLLTGLVVYWLSLLILARVHRTKDVFAGKLDPVPRWYAALLTALVFTLHPIQTQSVTYLVQRMNSLAAFLYLLALALYLVGRDETRGGRRWTFWILGLVSWGLSLGSKQITVTLPLVMLLYEWYFYQNLSTAWFRRKAAWGIGALVTLALVSIAQLWLVGEVFSHYDVRDFTMTQRLLTQARVLGIYVGLTLFPLPSRLNLLHEIETSRSLTEPSTTLFAVVGIFIFVAVAILIVRRSRLASFCLLWPIIHLAIESSILPLEMIYEHRMYLPLFGLALLFGTIFTYLLPRQAHSARLILVLSLAGVLTLATRTRNEVWRDPVALWSDVIAKSPTLARAYLNRGGEFVARGDWPAAISDFNRALALRPDDQAYLGRGMALFNSGRVDEAIDDFSFAYNAGLTAEVKALALRNRGTAYAAQGETQAAIADFSAAIKTMPGDVSSRFNRANAYRRLNEYRRAIADYALCVALSPSFTQAHNNLAAILASCEDETLRDPQRAIEHARLACELSGWSDWQLIDTLALAYAAAGEWDEAARWQLRAIELAPLDHRNEMRIRLDRYRAKRP